MLRLDLGLKIDHSSSSLSVACYTFASVVPGGSCLDTVKVSPSQSHFFVYLPAIHSNKSPHSTPSLLPPLDVNNKLWIESCKRRLQYKRPEDAKVGKDQLLKLAIYETVSNPEPNGSSSSERSVGELEAYALRHKAPTGQLSELGSNILAMTRIGIAVFSIKQLLDSYNSNTTTTLTGDVFDSTLPGILRGQVTLSVTVQRKIEFMGEKLDCFTSMIKEVMYKMKRDDVVPNALSLYSSYQERALKANKEYVSKYIVMFPEVNMKNGFRPTTTKGALHFNSLDPNNVFVTTQLGSQTPINDIHMPTAKVDGEGSVPIEFFYRSSTHEDFISKKRHEAYLGPICDAVCQQFGTTSELLAQSIHSWLDNTMKRESCSIEILADLRIANNIFTYMSTTTKYRSDFAVGSGNGKDKNLMTREDVARDIVIGLDSGDCEDLDRATYEMLFIIWSGVKKIKTSDWKQKDILWKSVLLPSKKQFGNWDHVGLSALQRLLGYYLPLNLIGAVTAPSPSDSSVPIVDIINLEEAQREFLLHPNQRGGVVREFRKLMRDLPDSLDNSKFQLGAHRWSALIPIQDVLSMLLKCYDLEIKAGSVRNLEDEYLMQQLEKLESQLPTNLPPLPRGVLEATEITNFFSVIGASNWLPKGSKEQEELKRLEMIARDNSAKWKLDKAPHFKDNERWFRRGVIPMNEGGYQLLPGDINSRRGSTFYSMITGCNIPFLGLILDSLDFTCSFLKPSPDGVNGPTFGIPIEDLLNPSSQQQPPLLTMPLHRIPLNIRNGMNEIGKQISQWYLPAQMCGVYPKERVAKPKLVVVPSATSPPQKPGLNTFGRTLFLMNTSIIADSHRKEFQEIIYKDTSNLVLCHEQKIQAFGPSMAIYSMKHFV